MFVPFRPQKKLAFADSGAQTTVRAEQVHVRRRQGYAAAEKRLSQRELPLCVVEEGEVLGDTEFIADLKTYAQGVTCRSACDVFILTSKNIDRLLSKKNPRTVEVLRRQVELKLRYRINYQQGSDVPLYRHLLFKLTEELRPTERKLPSVEGYEKQLPPQEAMFYHQLGAFVHNRAELSPPYVPGAVFLREKMLERAKFRNKARAQKTVKHMVWTRKRLNRRLPSAKPRSIKHLKVALRKQEETMQAVETQSLVDELRDLENKEMRDFFNQQLAEYRAPGSEDRRGKQAYEEELRKASRLMKHTVVKRGSQGAKLKETGTDKLKHSAQSADEKDNEPEEEGKERTFVTQLSQGDNQDQNVNGSKDASDGLNKDTGVTPGEDDQSAAEGTHEADEESEPRLKDSNQTINSTNQANSKPPLNDSTEMIITSQSDQAAMNPKERARLRFLRAFLKHKANLSLENPSYRDWQTSDRSLAYLEQRIRNFRAHREPTFVTLPSLSRYESKVLGPIYPHYYMYLLLKMCILVILRNITV